MTSHGVEGEMKISVGQDVGSYVPAKAGLTKGPRHFASQEEATKALELPWPVRSLRRRRAFQELYQSCADDIPRHHHC